MTSELVQAVSDGLAHDFVGLFQVTNDRAYVFVALVDQLGIGIKDRNAAKNVHNFLTYLFLGWNPITAWVRPHLEESPAERLWTPEYIALIKRMLNFKEKITTGERYKLLTTFERCHLALEGVDDVASREEELALSILALWFLTRDKEPCRTLDVVAVRACLDLYRRSIQVSVSSSGTVEYARDFQLGYSGWLYRQMQRLLVQETGLEELCHELAYMAWFACLIRAKRILSASGDQRVFSSKSLNTILERHVKELYKYLDEFPLVVVDETDGAANRLISMQGVQLKRAKK